MVVLSDLYSNSIFFSKLHNRSLLGFHTQGSVACARESGDRARFCVVIEQGLFQLRQPLEEGPGLCSEVKLSITCEKWVSHV